MKKRLLTENALVWQAPSIKKGKTSGYVFVRNGLLTDPLFWNDRYPNYKYQPQKRLLRPVRKYTRYKKDGAFTSRTKIYNTIMEHLYEHGPITDIDQLSLVGSPAPDSPAPTLYDSASSTASSPVCTPSTDPVSLQYPASPATCDTLLTPPLGYEVLVKAELLDHPVADTVYEAFIADLLRVEPHTGAMFDDIYSLLYPLTFEKPCIDPRMLDIKASDGAPETPTTEFVEESYILSHAG